jgi:hypothetical protein
MEISVEEEPCGDILEGKLSPNPLRDDTTHKCLGK